MTREEAIRKTLDTVLWTRNASDIHKNILTDALIKALDQEPILDKIRAEIIKYEGDCRLSDDEYPSCKECTDNVFETIYGILDKYKAE